MRRLSGLEYLRAAFGDARTLPPVAGLMGLRAVTFEEGRAVFEAEPAEFHYNPIGTVHGGFAATLLDSAMSCAVHAACKPGQVYTTVEIKVNYVRPMTAETGTVTVEGRTISVGGRVATSEGRITDARGRLLAHGTATCLLFPLET
jgi:uncharacterized protein (TIGR00369 family)